MQTQREHERHEGIALLPSLSLWDVLSMWMGPPHKKEDLISLLHPPSLRSWRSDRTPQLHCCTVVQICDGLQNVGDALTACFRGPLEGSNGFFSFLGNRCPQDVDNMSGFLKAVNLPNLIRPTPHLGWSPAPKLTLLETTIRRSLSNMGSPPCCSRTCEKLGFVHLETDRWGGLDHFFTQLAWRSPFGICQLPHVANVLGATCAPSRAILAADNSPRWTRFQAHSALFSTLSTSLLILVPPTSS